ncbi:hypothetical protein [Pseudomonas sp. GD03944]|uniref:hypothetical protein n=1 Tax=Pseudomonas sp. GD03944 TaxID=2975409 RepID=UPI00244C289D|nr:hypothetical protein [Pseudomonas sp. GD03944]MDH1265276.1 hypothetical protein [Pseudomonas sp. GD03944]
MSNRPAKTDDKTVIPKGAKPKKDHVDSDEQLEHPNPATEAVDKVITPTSIKKKERQAEAIEAETAKVKKSLEKGGKKHDA